jgi:hypothetical protein
MISESNKRITIISERKELRGRSRGRWIRIIGRGCGARQCPLILELESCGLDFSGIWSY